MGFYWNGAGQKKQQPPSWQGLLMSVVMLFIGIVFVVRLVTSREKVDYIPVVFLVVWCGLVISNMVYHIKGLLKQRKKDGTFEDYRPQYNPETGRYDESAARESLFCPYCGKQVEGDFEYCNRCGKRLP